ncbi:MAG TPA: BatA and WFA domain-containing protein [Gemmataceae bacterium]
MTPLHPILLTGAILVGLPILLHLIMRQEPKRLLFPAFRFLKQRRFINQRKIRLRHILLMAMRMLLIALMGLALFQPRLLSERFHIRSEQPLAAVIVIDTSPSMGYEVGETTRLDEAKRRAQELIDELPPGSSIAVIDTGDLLGLPSWTESPAEARSFVGQIPGTRAANRPVTAAIDQAYRLFQTVDAERQSPDEQPLPRFLAVFSDRTASSWEASRLEDLQAQRDRVPPPGINAVYVDVGVEKPVNLAVTDAEVAVSFGRDYEAVADVRVSVSATGNEAENVVVCRIDGEMNADKKPIALRSGETRGVVFRRSGLKPGLHYAEVSLLSGDSLPFDNVRFLTFEVPEPRPVLTVSDDADDARFWKLALEADNRFRCDVKTPEQVRDWRPEDWAAYQAVCLLNVADPAGPAGNPLWDALARYVEQGGSLVVLPGGDEMRAVAYDTDAAKRLLPGKYLALFEASDQAKGVTWLWNSLNFRHPILAPFREWQQQPNIDFIRLPPRVFKYWQVEPGDKNAVVVSYNDADKSPALLEGTAGRGKVLMFTVPMDARRDPDGRFWNDYLETSFYLVLSNLSVTYLVGGMVERDYNFQTGQTVRVPLPLSEAGKPEATYILEGPGIIGSDALLKRPVPPEGADPAKAEAYLTIDRGRTAAAGNFVVRSQDRSWEDRFSLNPPPEEGKLDRVEPEAIESLLGEGSVLAPEKELELGEVLQRRFNQPVDLFPWLMVLVLLLFAFENLLANRFYRKPPQQPEEVAKQ